MTQRKLSLLAPGLICLLPLLSACETQVGLFDGAMEDVGPGIFIYRVRTDSTYAAASRTAERIRLEALETSLSLRYGGCPDHFEITDRSVEVIGDDGFDLEHRVVYQISCPPEDEEDLAEEDMAEEEREAEADTDEEAAPE
ncbi:MAG: hypothetical protein ACPGOV_00545 [Magnetovibrionaceae bacterium]